MKKLLSVSLLSIAALLSARAQAQVLCALGPATSTAYDPMADMPASAGAQAELKKVKALLCPKGCGKVLLIANATAPNSATATDGVGASKIAYSPGFVASVNKTYGPIATFAIFAHELGHHLDATGNRAAWMKESWDGELRADAWAGCAMAKAELTPSRLQAALLALSTYPSSHHPEWSARRLVITEGYTRCGGKMLPPLGKESAEQASKMDGRKDDARGAAGGPGGCTGDKDCRNGRTCVSNRCAVSSERRRCGKDTDCPDPQECDPSGHCGSPASEARADEEPPKPAGPMLAALQSERPVALPAAPATSVAAPAAPAAAPAATPAASGDPQSCPRSCDEVSKQCIEAATGDATKCLAAIQSEPNYRACTCPNYPRGNYNCYRFCSGAYERGKMCSADNYVRDCRGDAGRCRSQCQ